MVILLLEWKNGSNTVDPTTLNNKAIGLACYYGRLKVVEALLQDARVDTVNAMLDACMGRQLQVVEALLQDERVDPSSNNNIAIELASYNGSVEIVKALLKDGRVDPTVKEEWAIKNAKTPEIKEMLIRYKYRVDGKEYQKIKDSI